jgi:quinol monooxygenase YgiN
MSDNKVTVLAKITIKPEKNTDAKAALLQLAKNTKSEKGCISYDLHQDTKEDTVYFFYEKWESQEDLDNHINHQNITDFKAATKDAILNLEMNTLEVIS